MGFSPTGPNIFMAYAHAPKSAEQLRLCRPKVAIDRVLPPLSNSCRIFVILIYIYIALNMTPSIDCYWVGAVLQLYTVDPLCGNTIHCMCFFTCDVFGGRGEYVGATYAHAGNPKPKP